MSFEPLKLLLSGLALALAAPPAHAQDYPSKVVTIIVPFAAGGPTDTVGRLLAQAMAKHLKQQVIVENVAGAGGTTAATRVAGAAPDGYTIFLHHIGHSTAPALYPKLRYDPATDFEPIGLATDGPMTVVAKNDFPAKDAKEFVAYVKANKDKVSLATAGPGAVSHLCALLFMNAIATPLTVVPYRGSGPVMNDLLAGQVDMTCDQTTNTISQIKANKIKVYCVATRSKLPALPEVPTCQEAGLANFEVSAWHALYAPKGTPKPVIDKLVAALKAALQDETVNQRLAELATVPMPQEQAAPEPLRQHLKAEIEKWTAILKAAGVRAE